MIRRRSSAYIRTGGYITGRAPMRMQRRKRRPWGVVPLTGPGRSNNVGISTNRGLRLRTRSGSMTRTQNYKGFASYTVKPSQGSTYTMYKSNMRPHPRAAAIRRVGADQIYNLASSYRLTGSTGAQAYHTWDCGETTDLNGMATQITGYGDTTDLILNRIYAETSFTNMSEATVYVDLYECTPRHSIGNANNPGAAANEGIADASGSTASLNSLCSTPTMSRQFTALWKIHKKFSFELSQGQSHCHKASYMMGQKWNQSLYGVYGSGWYLDNFSKSMLVIIRGVPLNDQTTKTNVSTSSTAVDMVRKESFYYSYNNPTNLKYTYTSALPAITTEYILDIGSGEPEALNVA